MNSSAFTSLKGSRIFTKLTSKEIHKNLQEQKMNTTVTNIAHGDSIIEERLAVSTKRQYQNKVDHFEHWVRIVHFEELVDEDTDEIMYENIGCEVLKEFLGHISKKRKRKEETAEEPFVYCDPEKLQSVQHVNGYKSALTDKFKRLGISLDFESKNNVFGCDDWIS